MKFAKGEHVLAKLPGTNIYHSATVMKPGETDYKLKFDDGKQSVIKVKDMKPERTPGRTSVSHGRRTPSKSPQKRRSPSKSPSRVQRRSPSKSPARKSVYSKSPSRARSRGRGKSPASPLLTKRSTSRKQSPTKQSTSRNESPTKASRRGRPPTRKDTDIKPPSHSSTLTKTSESTVLKQESIRVSVDKEKKAVPVVKDVSIVEKRASAESVSSPKIFNRMSTEVKSSVEGPKLRSKYSQEQSRVFSETSKVEQVKSERSQKSVERELFQPEKEFGGWFVALILILSLPLTVLSVHVLCTKESCSIYKLNIPTNPKVYFNLQAAGIYLGFFIFEFLFTLLPVGQTIIVKPKSSAKQKYRCNGFINTLLTVTLLATLKYYLNYPITSVVNQYIPLVVAATSLGYIFSLLLYISASRASVLDLNIYGNTGNFIYDFWIGREISPKIGPLDVKTAIMKFSLIGAISLHILIVLKNIDETSEYSATLILCAGLHLLYFLDFMWFESSFSTTFEVKDEGTGCMTVLGFALYPFLSTVVTKYIADQRVELSTVSLVVIFLISMLGFMLYRFSNSAKDNFKKKPLDPSLFYPKVIFTSSDATLLATGCWSYLRHPNYCGDIVMHWAWASLCGIGSPFPYIVAILTTILLLHRTYRSEKRCQQRYGTAWEKYCSQVKYRLIPYVF